MIIADLTIWSAALRGHSRGFAALFATHVQRGEVTAPGLVFAQLIGECEEHTDAARLRTWAQQVPPLDEPRTAWIAAGDLVSHLTEHGAFVSLVDAYVICLALREDAQVWSLNPRFEDVGRVVPLKRYLPPGT